MMDNLSIAPLMHSLYVPEVVTSNDINPSLDFFDNIMGDAPGFFKAIDDAIDAGVEPDIVLANSCVEEAEENTKLPAAPRWVPTVGGGGLSESLHTSSTMPQVLAEESIGSQSDRNAALIQMQHVSNAKKRRRRSGQPKKWLARFEQLRQFKAEFGHCRIPQSFPANSQLANWAHNQRKEYKLMIRGKPSPMTAERVRILENEGFNWSFRANRLTWEDRFRELQDFKSEHGHCLVPVKYYKNQTLGHWVINQRAQYKQFKLGKQTNMTEERAALLESEGFCWAVEDKKSFEERVLELREYREEHGDANVPIKYEKNPQLGPWIMNQRVQYRLFREGKQSSMTERRIMILEMEGMRWEVKYDNWDKRFQELKEYKQEHGDCKVPSRYSANSSLGQWVTNQRRQYKRFIQGKSSYITSKQVEDLESIGFVWSVVEQVPWESRFRELQDFREQHKHYNIPKDSTLGQWAMTQKSQYKLLSEGKRSSMSLKRAQMLEVSGFVHARSDVCDEQIDTGGQLIDNLSPSQMILPVSNLEAEKNTDDASGELSLLPNVALGVSDVVKDTRKDDAEEFPPELAPPEVQVNGFAI